MLQGFERIADTHAAAQVKDLESLVKDKEKFDYYFSNMKYYAVTKASEEYKHAWLEKHCKSRETKILDFACGNGENGVYADQTWMASLGEPSPKAREIWTAVRDARDAAIALVQERMASGAALRGGEVNEPFVDQSSQPLIVDFKGGRGYDWGASGTFTFPPRFLDCILDGVGNRLAQDVEKNQRERLGSQDCRRPQRQHHTQKCTSHCRCTHPTRAVTLPIADGGAAPTSGVRRPKPSPACDR